MVSSTPSPGYSAKSLASMALISISQKLRSCRAVFNRRFRHSSSSVATITSGSQLLSRLTHWQNLASSSLRRSSIRRIRVAPLIRCSLLGSDSRLPVSVAAAVAVAVAVARSSQPSQIASLIRSTTVSMVVPVLIGRGAATCTR